MAGGYPSPSQGGTPVLAGGYPQLGLGYAPPPQLGLGIPLERTWDQRPRKELGTGVPPECGQTHTCENSTCPHPSDADGNKWFFVCPMAEDHLFCIYFPSEVSSKLRCLFVFFSFTYQTLHFQTGIILFKKKTQLTFESC